MVLFFQDIPKLEIITKRLYHEEMLPNNANGKANTVDPFQTAQNLGLNRLPRPFSLKTWNH